MSMPDFCAIVENWELPILGWIFFLRTWFAIAALAGLQVNMEKAELLAGGAEHPFAAGDNPIPRCGIRLT
jgi:hypothetical protein